MSKQRILVTCLFLIGFQPNFVTHAAQASVAARKKPLILESLQSNFDDLKKLTSGSSQNKTEIAMKLGRIDKLITRLKRDEVALVAAMQAELVSIKRDLGYGQQLDQYSIPLLPEALARKHYPAPVAVRPQTGSVIDFQRTAPLPIGFSPDRGWVIATNGFIKGLIDGSVVAPQEARDLAKILFNISQEGNVVLTALPGNPAISLSATTVAQLIRLVHAGELNDPAQLTPEQFEKLAPFFKDWYATYQKEQATKLEAIKSRRSFMRHAKEVLKEIAASAQKDRSLTTDLLLAVVALRMKQLPFLDDQVTVFKEYGTALTGTEPKIVWYYEDDFDWVLERYNSRFFSAEKISLEIEYISFCMRQLSAQSKLGTLLFFNSEGAFITYQGVTFASCAEHTLRTLISMIFYDPVTEKLALHVVPQAVQESLSPELKAFIADHGVLKRAGNLTAEEQQAVTAADQAFADLIENRVGIRYHKKSRTGQECELDPSVENVVQMLRQLFGLPAENKGALPQEQFVALLRQVSTPEHEVAAHFEQLKEHNAYLFKVVLTIPKRNENFTVRFQFSHNHASVFLNQETVSLAQKIQIPFIVNVYVASLHERLFLLGCCDLAPTEIVTSLLRKRLFTTADDWAKFFDFYTSNFCQKKFPDFFYHNNFSIYFTSPYNAIGSNIRDFMISKGYSQEDAFLYALKRSDHEALSMFLRDLYYKPSVQQWVDLLDVIDSSPNLTGQDLLVEAIKKRTDLLQEFPFDEGEKSLLAWGCDHAKGGLVFALIRNNVHPTSKADFAKVLEFLDREETIDGFRYKKLLNSLKTGDVTAAHQSLFTEKQRIILYWGLQIQDKAVLEALTE